MEDAKIDPRRFDLEPGPRPPRGADVKSGLHAAGAFLQRRLFGAVERFRIGDEAFHVLLAAAIGSLSALATAAFLSLIDLAEVLFFGRLFPAMGRRASVIFLLPALGGLLVAPLVRRVPTEARWDGIPSAMEAVALRGGIIRFRDVALRTAAAVVTIGSGGSAGRFAPGAQLGAAGAIAAVFNAPIGGVFFALEVLLGDFSTQTFAPIVVAAVAATAVSRIFIGDILLLGGAPAVVLASPVQIGLRAVLGVFCGVGAALFIRAMARTE